MSDKDKKVEETEEVEEETEDETEVEDETSEADESEEEATDDEESEDAEESENSDDLDLDAELEKERKAGTPDPEVAKDAFKERNSKRKENSDDGDKPLTQKDLQIALANDRKERRKDEALIIAKGMAGSDKEAQLIVAKWNNRTFPESLTLTEQIREAYVITHQKKILGERDEAMRALKGKRGISKDKSVAHRDAPRSNLEPKLPPQEARQLKISGFSFNTVSRQYEKKLPSGKTLVRDNKTKQIRLLK